MRSVALGETWQSLCMKQEHRQLLNPGHATSVLSNQAVVLPARTSHHEAGINNAEALCYFSLQQNIPSNAAGLIMFCSSC